jgi:hypothetical protein
MADMEVGRQKGTEYWAVYTEISEKEIKRLRLANKEIWKQRGDRYSVVTKEAGE